MSTGQKIPLTKARNVADRFIKYITPYCEKVCIAGSVRRECEYVGDIEIVVTPLNVFSMGLAFSEGYKGMVVNGTRLKRFKYPESGIQIELYIVLNEWDYGRILAIRTGSSAYSHHLAVRWGRIGWAGTEDGLRRKVECNHKGNTWKIKPEYKIAPTLPPRFETEEDFFAFLSIEWLHPNQRSWVSAKEEYNYNV
jgi:DNA polymerase/3'-5' exonuclease PolX